MTKLLTLRPIDSDSDWEEILSIRRVLFPEFPISLSEIRANDKLFKERLQIRRLICRDGRIVGMLTFVESHSVGNEGTYVLRVICMPDDLEAFRFGSLSGIQLAESHRAQSVLTGIEDRRSGMVDVAKELGWETRQEQKVSRLDLADFALSNGDISCDIISLPELKGLWPEKWLQEYWTVETALMRDVPMPGEYKEPTKKEFEQQLQNPGFCWDGAFVALVEGRIAGTVSLSPSPADPRVGTTALTGVLRDFRRRGIARALKIHSLQWGKRKGIEFVVTDNEVNNPMYLLNMQLGFRHVFNQLWMAKVIKTADT